MTCIILQAIFLFHNHNCRSGTILHNRKQSTMKPIIFFFIVLVLVLSLAGCILPRRAIEPTKVSQSPSPAVIPSTQTSTSLPTITHTNTAIVPTATLKPSSTPTLTPTPLDTLEPAKVNELILALMQNPGECVAPCVWGIVPGKTTFDEANQFFYHLGISPYNSTIDGKDYASYDYELNNGPSINVLLGLQNNIVENLRIGIETEVINGKAESDWMAYSPSAIIKQYGKPSKVDFSWNLEYGNTTLFTTLYFNEYDLIVEYHNPNGPVPSSPVECPLKVNYDYMRLWIGKNPYYPPGRGIPLDEATSLTMDEFVKLMTGDPGNSCFNLDINAFLPHQ